MTGSLKHRLARSLFLHALVNGLIDEGTTVVEASSGRTAISEAYFARLLGLPFVAVMPASTSSDKIALIQAQGGRCHLVDDGSTVYAVAQDWPRTRAVTTWTSSPTPSGPRTGEGTTISLRPSSIRCARRPTQSHAGSSSAPAPAAPRRRSVVSSATRGTTRACAW